VASAAHSARLVAANKQGVRELAAAVARTHDPALVRFLVLAVPEWLPVEWRLERAGRTAGRGGHCKLCKRGLGEVPVSETVRHIFVCRNPRMVERMSRLVIDGVGVLIAAGVRVRGPCEAAPLAPCGAGSPPRLGRVCWVPVWFDPRRQFWMELVVREEYHVAQFSRRDPLGAVLGVLPEYLDRLLGWNRTCDGWIRRELRAQGELRGRLQIVLLKGALGVYRTRCKLMDEWWRAPGQAPDRDRLAASVAGQVLKRARGRAKRERDAYEVQCRARRDRRFARDGDRGDLDCSRAWVSPREASIVTGLALTMTSITPNARVGSNAVFVLRVCNTGTDASLGVVVSAPLPGGYAFVSADDPRFVGGTGLWSVGSLQPGAGSTVQVTALLLPTGPRDYRGEVLRRSGRRRTPIDYLAPLVYSPEDDPMVRYEGALYEARVALPHY
jgi:uncharacterized repeat protein (TIGR01451 family)